MQAESESIAEYSGRLRRLATNCNFGTFLPRGLRDQFLSGIRDGNTKKKVLSQDISTFEDAMKTAIADEAAKRESQLFQTNPIHVVKATPPNNHRKGSERRDTHRPKRQFSSKSTEDRKPSYTCFSCGETGHSRQQCKHRDKVCRLCNLKEHIAKVCRKTGVHSVKPDCLLHWCANMVANMAFTAFATGLLWSEHIFASYLRCANLMQIHFFCPVLTPAQRNYSQLDKEAFSTVFGIKIFHQYLSGRKSTIITDHRPLLSLFAPDRSVPLHVAARLHRWSLVLQSYNYSIEYRNTTAHAHTDSMSRLPLPETWEPPSRNVNCYFLENKGMSYVSSEMIAKATAADLSLGRVLQYTMTGWPHL